MLCFRKQNDVHQFDDHMYLYSIQVDKSCCLAHKMEDKSTGKKKQSCFPYLSFTFKLFLLKNKKTKDALSREENQKTKLVTHALLHQQRLTRN